jgi:hypothetical protein
MLKILTLAGLTSAGLAAILAVPTVAAAQPADPGCVRSNNQTSATGTVLGALGGALIGSAIAGRHDRGVGVVGGAVAGGVAGNVLAGQHNDPCPPYDPNAQAGYAPPPPGYAGDGYNGGPPPPPPPGYGDGYNGAPPPPPPGYQGYQGGDGAPAPGYGAPPPGYNPGYNNAPQGDQGGYGAPPPGYQNQGDANGYPPPPPPPGPNAGPY